jgi:hypothetical protein
MRRSWSDAIKLATATGPRGRHCPSHTTQAVPPSLTSFLSSAQRTVFRICFIRRRYPASWSLLLLSPPGKALFGMATTEAQLRTDSAPLEEPKTPPALPKSYAAAAHGEVLTNERNRAHNVNVANGMMHATQIMVLHQC